MDKSKIINCLPPELQEYGELLVDEIDFTYKHLQRLKKVDLILINKKDPTKQMITPAGKQYHDYLQSLQNYFPAPQAEVQEQFFSRQRPVF